MAKTTWFISLEDGKHIVELKHGYMSGRRAIHIDGKPLKLLPTESRQSLDLGSRHPFQLSGHDFTAVIRTNGLTFSYDLEMDGRSIKTGKLVDQETLDPLALVTAKRLAVIIAMIPLGLLAFWWNWSQAHDRGYYYEELAFLAPIPFVLAAYYAIFPEDPTILPKPIPLRLWITVVIAIGLGAANAFALAHGLY